MVPAERPPQDAVGGALCHQVSNGHTGFKPQMRFFIFIIFLFFYYLYCLWTLCDLYNLIMKLKQTAQAAGMLQERCRLPAHPLYMHLKYVNMEKLV